MEKIIASQRTSGDSIVHRGVALTPEQVAALTEGSVMEDAGLMSTADDPSQPKFYVRQRQLETPGTRNVMFEIRVPKGTNAVDVSYGEYVFARRQKLLIRKVVEDGRNVRVIAEMT